jgi:sugar phosphate isomerase/epimerase
MFAEPPVRDQAAKVEAAARAIRPVAEAADKLGCKLALYNHGGWSGEPENQIAVIEALRLKNVGIVYNLHHGHDHLDRFAELLKKMRPYLLALNLNGMVKDGERTGKKILPLGAGDQDLALLKTIRASGFTGPIGILGHTQDDAAERLADNLDGLAWLKSRLEGKDAAKPKYRTYNP